MHGGGLRMALSHKLQWREIIAKAVCGKGRKFSSITHTVTPPHAPNSVLGAWIINHQYQAKAVDDGVEVVGTYDVNIWYSHSKNSQTDVFKESLTYVDFIPLSYLDPKHQSGTAEVTATVAQEPTCIEATVAPGKDSVKLLVEREFVVDILAQTRITVAVSDRPADYGLKDYEYSSLPEGDYEMLDPDSLDDDL